ncbi:MAG: type pilus assembly protein PilC [Patescibacteria group bacterium]|jgi:type IV pilus assembly protein PilC|nr:type pilus assembly protein PilC [Patescibacteria group bacterium]
MLFKYTALDKNGKKTQGEIDALNKTVAISALQRRDLIVVTIKGDEDRSILKASFFDRVPLKDVVIASRQLSTLFTANVSALKAFTLLASNAENKMLASQLQRIGDDLQAGSSISDALGKFPNTFSLFYVNMVKAGEESGKLNETFQYLADYLDRQYALTSKTRSALIYPAFVVVVFIAVMLLMFTMVIPNLSQLLVESGQEIPFYTRIVIGISNFIIDYGVFIAIALILGAVYVLWFRRNDSGKEYIDRMKLSIPVLGDLYKKVYLSRISDNLNTMLSSGISIIRSIEITSEVVNNYVYKGILNETKEDVKSGSSLSNALNKHKEIPQIMIQMVQVGEETGSLGSILKTLAEFYRREVDDAVDTMIGLIEPVMIVGLAVGVGILLTSILIPIYNIASSIS